MKIIGIYKIINKINGKYYVGSSNNIESRWKIHRRHLIRNKHHCKTLQRSWTKHGEHNFDFVVLENTAADNLFSLEQKYLDVARTEKNRCYNLSFIAGRVDMTDQVRKQIGNANRGKNNGNYNRIFSEEERKRMSESHKGEKHHMWGKHHSKESIRKNSESNKLVQKGKNNARYIPIIHRFIHEISKELFEGTRYDFYTKYQLSEPNVRGMIAGKNKSVKKWKLIL